MDGQNDQQNHPQAPFANVTSVMLSASDLLHLIENKWEAVAPPRLLFSGVVYGKCVEQQ